MESFSSVNDLIKFYNQFHNNSLLSLYQIVKYKYPHIKISKNKGIVGQVLEALIGNAPNSNPQQDVKEVNVELKVLPLRRIGEKIQPKERSKIKSINYNKIIHEEWESSEVRTKMQKILFLLYEHPTGKTFEDWEEFIFRGCILYEVEKENEPIVKNDWNTIKNKVIQEIADKISEGDSRILGACTSGVGNLVCYGRQKQAKQRSYSLKHNYLKVFYDEKVNNQKYVQLKEKSIVSIQDYIVKELNDKLKNKTLVEISNQFDIIFSHRSKSSFSLLLNKVFNLKENVKIRDLEEEGIVIKTIPINSKNKAWEAMSFPKFSLVDLIYEVWEDEENEAEFKKIISNGFVFVPIIKEKEKVSEGKIQFENWTSWKIGKTFFWKPNEVELRLIKKEWELAKTIVEEGVKVSAVNHGEGVRQENNLLKSTATNIIHIRPHARDSNDYDKPYYKFTENKVKISWQSFWLNKSFINSLLKNAMQNEVIDV